MKKLSTILIIFGILGLVAAILVDIVRTGALKIQAAQILVIELSVFVLALGLILRQISLKREVEFKPFSSFFKWLSELPLTFWVWVGFLFTYLVFFISPMFFGHPPRMEYFNKYLPDRYPVGSDLHILTDIVRQYMESGQTPFHITLYPPLTYLFFSPLTLVDDPNILYRIITLITILCFILASFIIPHLMNKREDKTIIVVCAVTGMLSYGMQFELERGQFNMIAFLFGITAIYIYHHHNNLRGYAYLLFTLSVQLKIYPAILILMLVRDWADWKGNLRRFLALGIVNFFLLFIMGWEAFTEFTRVVRQQISSPGWSWEGNHSIKSFISEFSGFSGFGANNINVVEFIQKNQSLTSNLLLAIFFICLFSAIYLAYKRKHTGMDMSLFLIVTIGALIIPVSNDYTLPILAAPAALSLTSLAHREYGNKKIFAALFLLAASAAYSSVLYPFKYKPLILQNAFPYLFILLITITILNHFSKIQNANETA